MKNKITSICAFICIISFVIFLKQMIMRDGNTVIPGLIAVIAGVIVLINLMNGDDNEDDYNYTVV